VGSDKLLRLLLFGLIIVSLKSRRDDGSFAAYGRRQTFSAKRWACAM